MQWLPKEYQRKEEEDLWKIVYSFLLPSYENIGRQSLKQANFRMPYKNANNSVKN